MPSHQQFTWCVWRALPCLLSEVLRICNSPPLRTLYRVPTDPTSQGLLSFRPSIVKHRTPNFLCSHSNVKYQYCWTTFHMPPLQRAESSVAACHVHSRKWLHPFSCAWWSEAAHAYANHLSGRHDMVLEESLKSGSFQKIYSYTTVLNAFTVKLTDHEQVSSIIFANIFF